MKMQKITENHSSAQNFNEQKLEHESNKNILIAGKISIFTLKAILAGAQNCLLPTVSAATKDETPKRPPPMKYKDLPIYDSPHLRYKEFENDKIKCEDRKVTHELLLPTVSEYRKQVANFINMVISEIKDTCFEVSRDYRSAEKQILEKMRCPKNMNVRLAFVAAGGILGLRLGKSIPRRVFYTSLGLFVTGSICFPKETDESARTVFYLISKAFIPLYNFYFGSDWVMRERVPCERDLPKIPPPTKPLQQCEPKK